MEVGIVEALVIKSLEIAEDLGVAPEEVWDNLKLSTEELRLIITRRLRYSNGKYYPLTTSKDVKELWRDIKRELLRLGFTDKGSPDNPKTFSVIGDVNLIRTNLQAALDVLGDIDPTRAAIIIINYYETCEYCTKIDKYLGEGFPFSYQNYVQEKSNLV